MPPSRILRPAPDRHDECGQLVVASRVAQRRGASGYARVRTVRLSGIAEDVVGSDATPHDVRLARHDLGAVLKGGSAVGCPGHLPDAGMSLDALDTEAGAKGLALSQLRDEVADGGAESALLVGRKPIPIAPERREDL